jgi:hypothetical protein
MTNIHAENNGNKHNRIDEVGPYCHVIGIPQPPCKQQACLMPLCIHMFVQLKAEMT